jgi:hypothetical protein
MHPRRSLRRGAPLLAALALIVVPASAHADSEPNDGLLQAEAPISGGVTYQGKIATANDVDWYMFYANSQVELDIAVSSVANDCEDEGVTLRDGSGGYIGSAYGSTTTVGHIRHTTPPGVNRFYLEAVCYQGEDYQFRIDPASGVTTGPHPFGSPAPLGEPNEFRSQAIGPLLGGVDYSGVTATANDVDWFFFYAHGDRALQLTATAPANGCEDDGIELLDGSGSYIAATYPARNQITSIRHTTSPGIQLFYLKADCYEGEDYLFRIDPADAITAQPPPPPPGPTLVPCPAGNSPGVRCIARADGSLEIHGTARNDRIVGSKLGDLIGGKRGNDWIDARGGNDDVRAGYGNDIAGGRRGNDKLRGGPGRDRLFGDEGNDRLFGEEGNDRVRGGDGYDRLKCDSGRDRAVRVGSGDLVNRDCELR